MKTKVTKKIIIFCIIVFSLIIYSIISVQINIVRRILEISNYLNKTEIRIYDYGGGSGIFLKMVEVILKIINPNITLIIKSFDIKCFNKYYDCSKHLSKDNYDIILCSYCLHHIENENHLKVINYLTKHSIFTIFVEDERMFMNMCKKHLNTTIYNSKFKNIKKNFYKKRELMAILKNYCNEIIYNSTIYIKFPFHKTENLLDKFYYNPTFIIVTKN